MALKTMKNHSREVLPRAPAHDSGGIDSGESVLTRLVSLPFESAFRFIAVESGLVDAGDHLTALARHELSGQRNYTDRNHIEKWSRTVTVRIDRFRLFWRGSRPSATRWLRRFRRYSNQNRPNQALDGRTPAEVVLNQTVPLRVKDITPEIAGLLHCNPRSRSELV